MGVLLDYLLMVFYRCSSYIGKVNLVPQPIYLGYGCYYMVSLKPCNYNFSRLSIYVADLAMNCVPLSYTVTSNIYGLHSL